MLSALGIYIRGRKCSTNLTANAKPIRDLTFSLHHRFVLGLCRSLLTGILVQDQLATTIQAVLLKKVNRPPEHLCPVSH